MLSMTMFAAVEVKCMCMCMPALEALCMTSPTNSLWTDGRCKVCNAIWVGDVGICSCEQDSILCG